MARVWAFAASDRCRVMKRRECPGKPELPTIMIFRTKHLGKSSALPSCQSWRSISTSWADSARTATAARISTRSPGAGHDAPADREQPANRLRAPLGDGGRASSGSRKRAKTRASSTRSWRISRGCRVAWAGDRTTVTDYLDAVREVERRIQRIEARDGSERFRRSSGQLVFRIASTSTSS